MARIKREQLLEKMFHDDYEHLKGKRLRMTRMRVAGKEVIMANLLTPTDAVIYQNLGLHIGTHLGEDHTGETIGLVRVTPWESVIIAADVASKSANVQVCFMDRFCGALILTGELAEVETALEEIVRFFRDVMGFHVCDVHKS